jgi:hypothetical protein
MTSVDSLFFGSMTCSAPSRSKGVGEGARRGGGISGTPRLTPLSLLEVGSGSTASWSIDLRVLPSVTEVEIREVTAGAGAGRLPNIEGKKDNAPVPGWEPDGL